MEKIHIHLSSNLILFIIIFSASNNPSLSCPDQQKQALLQFKSLFTLKPVNSSSEEIQSLPGIESWNSTSDCCEWPLVTCNPRSVSRPVISLNLYSFSLSLAPNSVLNSSVLLPLFHIRTLTMLDISYNNIRGEIPANGFSNWSRLVHLDLRENHFMGSIPPQIFHLRYLNFLDLSTNLFSGVLSNEVASLKNLQVLKLDENFLTEEIPKAIGNLTQLRELSLSQNRFSGVFPDSILNLKKLEVLDLSNNSLSSQIPMEIGIRLSNLTTLALNKNLLTGEIPSSLQNLGNLKELQLGNNFLSGDIPIWLFDLEGLTILDLGGNNLTWNNMVNSELLVPKFMLSKLNLKSCRISGPIPSWISTQTKSLQFLDLSENQLQGTFPQWLAESDLGTIILSDNKLTGSLPSRLFESLSLSVLALSRNKFSGELPKNIGNANAIMILMLANNNFSGPVPESLSEIYRLLLLDLSGNQFSGDIFPRFTPDSLLAYVDVSRNKLSGEVPVNFGTRTKILALGQNEFSGKLPQNLSNMNQLEHLDLHNNKITGALPDSISKISTLEILNVRNNFLEGPIPQSLSNISSLRILDLSNNQFTSRIPPKFGNFFSMMEIQDAAPMKTMDMFKFQIQFNDLVVTWKKSVRGLSSKNLEVYYLLDLSKNQLSGEIPDSLGGLKGLKILNISRNYKISGKIPQSFGDLTSIESLDLSHNNLSGELPQTLAKLNQLTILDVSNNKLVGRIPVGGQMDTIMNDPIYSANNSGLCGKQIQIPCPLRNSPPPGESSPGTGLDQAWFSWVGAGIGFPIGLLSVVLATYVFGYLSPDPKSRKLTRFRSR